MFNEDRKQAQLPMLATIQDDESFKEASAADGSLAPAQGAGSAWSLLAPPDALPEATTTAAQSAPQATQSSSDAESEYATFWDALPRDAQEMLEDLYGMGILSKSDPIPKQARYTRALNKAYERPSEKEARPSRESHQSERTSEMSARSEAFSAREARHRRRRASLRQNGQRR